MPTSPCLGSHSACPPESVQHSHSRSKYCAGVRLAVSMLGCVQASDRPLALPYKVSPLEGPPLVSITWQIDNFSAFKDILETRKLFSKYAGSQHCP